MTANMTNRDAKGKFTKAPAETVSFKIGDHVQKIGSTHRSMTPNGTHGVVDALDPIGVAWDGHHRQTYAHCVHEHIQPAPAPCPFKVGDRVERNGWSLWITGIADLPGRWNLANDEGNCRFYNVHPDELRKVENAPAKSCRVDVDLLIYERDGLLDEVSRLKTEAKERANAYSQNMQAVKDELAEAKRQATWWESVNKSTAFREKAEQRERWKAEAKLADIAAINRVAEIVNALPEGSEDWHFQGLVADVLKGTVAA